jgi:IS30 family transposase
LLGNKPTLEPIERMTDRGWSVVGYKPLVDIKQIAFELGREPKTIMNELIRGKYQEIALCIAKQRKICCYSKDASDGFHKRMVINKQKQSLKIYQHKDLLDFILLHKCKQSLNSIAGRTKLVKLSATISRQTLYNYVDNPRMAEIDRS